MRKQMIEDAAHNVAEQVRTVEDVIDSALTEIAELQGRMLRARAVAQVGVRTGQDALQHLSEALSSLVSARGGIGNCHAALVDATSVVPGLRTVSFGNGNECPPSKAQVDLRVVA